MASNSSGMLGEKETYTLGKYVFSIVVTRLSDEQIMAITANVVCEGQRAVKGKEFPIESQIEGWYVEANDTTADVYVQFRRNALDTGDVPVPVPSSSTIVENYTYNNRKLTGTWTVDGVGVSEITSPTSKRQLMASSKRNAAWSWVDTDGTRGSGTLTQSFRFQNKTVYYSVTSQGGGLFNSIESVSPRTRGDLEQYAGPVAWTMVYGIPLIKPETELIARFEIDLETAGGGPDGDWDEPGDTGDPSYTLNLTVTGASAGTHNSNSFPSDNETIKGYGCGGDGGHGGGGGAGASTVIIYEFATDKAGSVNQEAYTREPGVGSGGGKGGKGGDGCILIYY